MGIVNYGREGGESRESGRVGECRKGGGGSSEGIKKY
jgi:hypothetical protein